ncbi:coiled-coil domain-containing protein 15 [Erinaceus europaeus]|uniref:Coiled-coil domain-containing protein 15 n=1 Tax=Erinaceus europaeus TaxID=9365 RepID=A0ABM3WGW3_ERIEU|nr:coiled-coil domain-containing protein 15 [Erinaceus europaeus]
MPGCMAPLQKPGNGRRAPLALNPQKSKDVLAVLAERNQAVVAVGAWVEPASPASWEVSAHTSACIVEEELKEQLRKKQEALKNFQRKVKQRVNQQIRLRKKQQLQKSYEAAEKEGCIVMHSSDPAHLTPKQTSVFPNTLNVAIGTARLPLSQMCSNETEDRENQDESFQQQAQALIQSMKQARHRLASFKTVNKINTSKFTDYRSFSAQELSHHRKPEGELPYKICQSLSAPLHTQKVIENQEPDSEEYSSVMIGEKKKENLFWRDQQDFPSGDKNIPFSGVQKVQFKNPLFAVMGEEHVKHTHLQNILPRAQDCFPEACGDLETQDGVTEGPSVELDAQDIEQQDQATEPKAQAIGAEAQNIETETQESIPEVQTTAPGGRSIVLRGQRFLPKDQDFLPKDDSGLAKDQNILPTYEDQDSTTILRCQNQDFLPTDQKRSYKQPSSILLDRRGEREVIPLDVHQDILQQSREQAFIRDKKVHFRESYSGVTEQKGREDSFRTCYQNLPLQLQDQACIRDQHSTSGLASYNMTDEREKLFPQCHEDVLHEMQVPISAREQNKYFWQQPSLGTTERWREDFPLDGRHLPPKHQRVASSRKQVFNENQSGLNSEFQTLPTFQSGLDQEEDKKERQKQYLRYRRLFMDIEREQVKEQQRQKEHKKKIEKIKKKKEQQRFAEEQRLLRMKCPEEPYSEEKMSEILAQLQLEEIKGAREKQQQREKEYQRYVEALRVQIQEKMQLHNITLPPLCYCGPEFWDAHPDTCANNCIFYKNHRAYTQALHSVINSCDIPEGNSTLRIIISQFASVHRRTLKNL